jgi:FtsZ-interacting cell division protein ZipA
MKEVIIYIVIIAIVAVFVFINYKKSQGTYRNRRHKRFRDSYLDKKKKKEDNEDLH